MKKMNPEVKAKWLEALRSGRYKQAQRALKAVRPTDGKMGYCCLGVLCDISGLGTWIDDEGVDFSYQVSPVSRVGSFLSAEIAAWAGLESGDPGITEGDDAGKLSYMNDKGATFEEIADLIEEHF